MLVREMATRKREWTILEDAYVISCIKAYGKGHWAAMGRHLKRTGAQCAQRWNKVLDPNVLHHVKWSADEDELLVKLHMEHPEWKNKQYSQHIPRRTASQCSNRWNDKLNPRLRWNPWTKAEDEALIDGRSKKMTWSQILKVYECLKNRANVAAKNRYHKVQKQILKNKKKKQADLAKTKQAK